MIPSLEIAHLIQSYAAELSLHGLVGWTKINVYREHVVDSEGDDDSLSLEECWVGDKQFMDLSSSYESEMAFRKLYDACKLAGNPMWTGMRLEVLRDGKYHVRFYYDSHPLLDGDYDEAEARIASNEWSNT